MTESRVQSRKARVSAGEDRSNVCIHSCQNDLILVGSPNVGFITERRGILNGISGEATIDVGEDLIDGERGCD